MDEQVSGFTNHGSFPYRSALRIIYYVKPEPPVGSVDVKTIQFKAYGGPEQLIPADVPCPDTSANQLLVEVAATSVNPIDWKLHNGMLRWVRPLRFPSTPCFDFAGVIKAVGTQVSTFKPGDRIFGMLPMQSFGAAAEYLAVDEKYAAPIPSAVSFHEAAGIPLAGMTALQALRDQGCLKPGQRLLVIGGAGGVGHYAIQIGKAMGAHVTGVCSTRNLELARTLGADEVINYARTNLDMPSEAFDVILDTVIDRSFSQWRAWLGPEGIYVSLLPKFGLFLHSLRLKLFSRQRIRFTFVRPNRKDLDYLAGLAQDGLLHTEIDSVHALAELGAALRKSQSGRARGKIIVAVKTEN